MTHAAPSAIIGAIEAPQHYRIAIQRELNHLRAARINQSRYAASGATSQAERAGADADKSQEALWAKISDATGIPVAVLRREVFNG